MAAQLGRDRLLAVLVFTSGFGILALEMSAARLLAPFFGMSLVIWANLIGLVMVALAVGYLVGGRWADRDPRRRVPYQIVAWAGFYAGLIPLLARPVLNLAATGFQDLAVDILLGSLVALLALFAVPVVLLACVGPFAIRLQAESVDTTGRTAGGIYALSTAGSLVGTFLPVLVTIPALGTRATFLLISLLLLAVSLAGLFQRAGRGAWAYVPLPLIVVGTSLLSATSPVKAAEGLLYEAESPYHYIQVVEEDGERRLLLNEGGAIHSVYHPDRILSGGIWDFFLLAPFFSPDTEADEVGSLLLIGLAGGTVARQYTSVYGPIPIDGVEIDPGVVDAGRAFFGMDWLNLRPIVEDGRRFLLETGEVYDVIAVDAYRQPYIPFYLTTREFFQAARDHLTPGGVVAVNAARTASDARLVEVLAGTMGDVFEGVYLLDAPGETNTLVIGTQEEARLGPVYGNLIRLSDPTLLQVASWASDRIRLYEGDGPVFTDDRAPVEHLIHQIALRFLLEGE